MHKPEESSLEIETNKIVGAFGIENVQQIMARRPDLVISN